MTPYKGWPSITTEVKSLEGKSVSVATDACFSKRFIFIVKPADTHGGRVRNNNKS